MAWGETPDLSLKQLSLPLPITQAATLTFPNIIGLYKYVTFFNNTAYQIALSGNGIPIFTCPAYKNITVQIPAAIHQMQQANYVAVWSGSTGTPVNQAYLVFSENNLGLNIDLSPGAGTPGGAIDTDLLNILAELVTLAGSTTLAQLLTALGAGGAITTELTRLDTDLLALIPQNNSAYPPGSTPFAISIYGPANAILYADSPSAPGQFTHITNLSAYTQTGPLLQPTTVSLQQDRTTTNIQLYVGYLGFASPANIIHPFSTPIVATEANKTISLQLNAGGFGVNIVGNISGYLNAIP
jgi:hypothetical protein